MLKPVISNKLQSVVVDQELVKRHAEQIYKERQALIQKEQTYLEQLRKNINKLEKDRENKERVVRNLKRQKKEEMHKIEQQRLIRKKEAEQARIEKEYQRNIDLKTKKKAKKLQVERERREREAALRNIFEELEIEAKQNTSDRARYISNEVDRYGLIYVQLIQKKFLKEESFHGKSCRVHLNLIPTGSGAIVGGLHIIDGYSSLCAAAKRAITQVGTFPLPKEADIVERLKNINLTVVP
ncbi:cell envelope integrity protein TolA [Candidatus Photodesmus blepharus]|uniref:cell envelope integrity protein TolA n=1 Tax=Candidatus Photodesmus blepharonis TaxID=1179155 RepID=UPI001F5E637F|nr:cell envelope integrity protein TolA [Candidatus Photodesmus blepharus]